MAKKKRMDKWDRERLRAKERAKGKQRVVQNALDGVEQLWKAALPSPMEKDKSPFTNADREAIADASYSLRAILGGWLNDRRR